MIKIKEIYEGWRNNLLPPEKLKDQIAKVSAERLSICEECENHSSKHSSKRPDAHCVSCGCTLSAKTKCLSCSCPVKKWESVLTEEEESEYKKHEESLKTK
jgi:hypothetical protein|uniref:Uncharacterized protein n=1 Tax=Virus NIOZ-UU157 TaxID=2763269 RepID=A0A7S9XDX8_9VIRU|nr:MAG: hypothetical protein NIOZUU157_00285 [Virus NIOZ-UU157]|tara:strand:+ start:1648 stop:1950 length:303 start_codon:yes stop_codon:yes gene_type:complete